MLWHKGYIINTKYNMNIFESKLYQEIIYIIIVVYFYLLQQMYFRKSLSLNHMKDIPKITAKVSPNVVICLICINSEFV